MGRYEVPDTPSTPGGSSGQSSPLDELPRTPTPPPEIHIPVLRPRVHFESAEEDDDRNANVLRDVIKHENIVDFYHVPANSAAPAPVGREDPEYRHQPNPPDYIPRFTDILTLKEILERNQKSPGFPGVPEPRVWHVLMSVLKALTFLHTGRKLPIEKHEAPGDWTPVVHNDIQPENIIFHHPIAKGSKKSLAFRYGKCKLRNFRRAVVLSTPGYFGPENPALMTGVDKGAIIERREDFEHLYFEGERTGLEAPEIIGDDFAQDEYPGTWSDLFSLGALAVTMMIGRNIWHLILEIEFEERAKAGHRRGELPNSWRQASMQRRHRFLREYAGTARIVRALPELYSLRLRQIVEALLCMDPLGRGDTDQVLEEVTSDYDRWIKKGFRIFEIDEEELEMQQAEVSDQLLSELVSDAERYLAGLN